MQKKRAYFAPALAKYGSMKSLTLSSGGSGADSLGQAQGITTTPENTGFPTSSDGDGITPTNC